MKRELTLSKIASLNRTRTDDKKFFFDRTANQELTRKDAIHRNSYSTRTGNAGNSDAPYITSGRMLYGQNSIKFNKIIRSHCTYLTYTLYLLYVCRIT